MVARSTADFWRMLPRRSYAVFLGAVFCVFAPLGLLVGSSFLQQEPGRAILLFLLSGMGAVCWAAAFTWSRVWISGIVALTAAQMALLGPQRSPAVGPGGSSSDAILMICSIVLGYILFIVFINGQGRRTMRLQTEMMLARDIHETLVPPLELDLGNIEAVGAAHASAEVGGDLIDLVRHSDGTDFLLADVAGHGVKAGVVMGMVKSATRAHLMSQLDLGELMTRLNTVIEQTTSAEMYSTFVGLRIRADRLEYAMAGHEHVLHYRATEERVHRLCQQQMPLGLMAGQTYESVSVPIGSGDVLAVYTDGLNETENRNGEQLGHDGIERMLTQKAGGPLSEAREAILDVARQHGPQTDDQTLLLVRIKGQSGTSTAQQPFAAGGGSEIGGRRS